MCCLLSTIFFLYDMVIFIRPYQFFLKYLKLIEILLYHMFAFHKFPNYNSRIWSFLRIYFRNSGSGLCARTFFYTLTHRTEKSQNALQDGLLNLEWRHHYWISGSYGEWSQECRLPNRSKLLHWDPDVSGWYQMARTES